MEGSEGNQGYRGSADTMDLTGFIFGNVDEKGDLEGDSILNKDELVQLSRLGVVQGLGEVVGEESEDKDDDIQESVVTSDKLATAQDFADITELADEGEEEKERLYQKGMMYVQAQTASSTSATESYDDNYDVDDDDYDEGYNTQSQHASSIGTESSLSASESQSLPPTSQDPVTPAPPSSSPVNKPISRLEDLSSLSPASSLPATEQLSVTTQPPTPAPEPHSVDKGMEELPVFLPEGITSFAELQKKVKAIFPDYKPDINLRFLSMLGPGRKSSHPKFWQGARKRRKLSTDDSSKKRKGMLTFDFGPDPTPDMCASDDEDKFLTPVDGLDLRGERKDTKLEIDKRVSEWRNGPARVWYDMINVPENGRGFDYGFNLIKKAHSSLSEDEGKPPSPSEPPVSIPDDAFLMVTQKDWENDILWDVPHSTGPPVTAHGGVWTTVDGGSAAAALRYTGHGAGTAGGGGAVLNIPVDNHELVYGRWEDDIIWDSERVSHIPRPMVVRLDPNDPNIVVGIPDEPVVAAEVGKEGKKDGKKPTNKLWMNKLGKKDGNTQLLSFTKKDPFNLSNDEYYNPNHTSSTQGLPGFDQSNIVQHSTPALDLHIPWFPTYLSTFALRHFHRPVLKIKANGSDTTGWITISSLVKQINKKEKEREKERVLSGGGEVFFMRSPEDLSATDSHTVLMEYCEEHPPLIMATGMSSKIKNYYRRPERQVKGGAPNFSYGETTYIQNTPYFLGSLQPGQSLQSFENNLFRAPIYPHSVSPTDFLLIRSDNKYYVRELSDVFVIGQECPKVEVPAPNSKIANQFQKELLQVFLYRLFQESDDNPKKLKMELVRRAFPPSVMSESVVRKVLKLYADFRREGYDSGSWVLKPDCRLPTDEELRALVTPEQACAYYSMSAAEQRLKDAGYGGKSLFLVDDEEEEDSTQKIDDEIRAAPWNTTHHFINAMKDKYQLSVRGPADPTGCGEGFSYTRLNPKEAASHSGGSPGKKPKAVMGTDADLRKLKLNKARSVLRNFGVPEEEIGKLSRWQVIDMVRTISTEAAKSGGDVSSLMFARGARSSHVEIQERYREDCQRVFELQNKVLSSTEVLSTDEESSDSGGESDDELGRNLESLLSSKKTAMELSHEQEEIERQELRRLLLEDQPIGKSSDDHSERDRATPSGDGDDTSSVRSFSSITGRHLVISRTFRDEEGREYVRHEVVKNQAVIDAYVHIVGGSKDKDVRKQFAEKDEQTREDMRKEVKRIQHQLRQLDKMEERAKQKVHKTKKEKFSAMHVTCSACGQRGHMKTNKNCPKYKYTPVQVAPTDQELAQQETPLSQDDLVKVEGTKVLLNRALLDHANDVRRKSLLLRFPKDKVRKRKRQGDEVLDYLEKRAKAGKRRRTNPQVPFTLRLEKVINMLAALPEAWAFCKPVSAKTVPDYHRLIKFPMDLQTMKENNRKHRYSTREQFWEHVNLIANNCITYNGFNSDLTKNGQKMLEKCTEEMTKHTKELEQLEKEINPLLGDKPQPALSYLLKKAVERMKEVPESWPFHYPVSAKKLPDYRMIITRPMDLDTMKKHCERHHYLSREEFLVDLEQIVENSITYNGPNSQFTNTAQKMKTAAMEFLEQQAEILAALESQLPPRDRSISRSPSLFLHEGGSSSLDSSQTSMATCLSLSGGRDAITVESEFGGEVDVEGLDEELVEEEEDGVDLHSALLEDLQHSSSSSDSDSEGSDAED